MIIDLASLSPTQVYLSLIQTVIPRPIAWVLSDNGDAAGKTTAGIHGNDRYNLAPFSYFNAVSSEPPLIMLSLSPKPDTSQKDSRLNIEQRKHFVVHIAHRELAPYVNESSRTLPHGESELDRVPLSMTEFDDFSLPRISQCRVALACEHYSSQQVGAEQTLILGLVRKIYVSDDACEKDAKGRTKIRADIIDPLGRLGADEYCTMGEVITLRRPV